jgi:hypothetical protein
LDLGRFVLLVFDMNTLSLLALHLMFAIRALYGESDPAWSESYRSTAMGIADACEAAPLPGGGPEWCVAVAVDFAWHESRFRSDASHDRGAGAGLFGTHTATLGRPIPADEAGQAEAFVALMHESFTACHASPLDERAAEYASGSCEGRRSLSRFRLHEAARLLRGR